MTIDQLQTEIYLSCPDAQSVRYVLRHPDPEDGLEVFEVDDGHDMRLVAIDRDTLRITPF